MKYDITNDISIFDFTVPWVFSFETPQATLPLSLHLTRKNFPNFLWPPSSWWTSYINDLSLSAYVKKWIVLFIVNKLILIYFTWFVYTFANCKYNVLLKRDNVCLMPLSTFVTLSCFDDGKKIRIVRSKMV